MKKFLTGILLGGLVSGLLVYFLVSGADGNFIKLQQELQNQYAREFQQRMTPEFVRASDVDTLSNILRDEPNQSMVDFLEAHREDFKRINDGWIDSLPFYPRPLDVIAPKERIVRENYFEESQYLGIGDDLTAHQRIILFNASFNYLGSIWHDLQINENSLGSNYVFSSENIGSEKSRDLRFSPIAFNVIIYRSEDSKNLFFEHYNQLFRVEISINEDGYYVPGKVWVSDV